jgi:hypothetical protein
MIGLLRGAVGAVGGAALQWAIIAALGASLVAGLLWYRAEAATAGARAAQSERLLADNAAALAELTRERDRAVAALEAEAVAARRRDADFAAIRSAIHAAPVSTACVASPAVRAALGGLQRRAAAGGGPGGAGGGPAGAAGVRP